MKLLHAETRRSKQQLMFKSRYLDIGKLMRFSSKKLAHDFIINIYYLSALSRKRSQQLRTIILYKRAFILMSQPNHIAPSVPVFVMRPAAKSRDLKVVKSPTYAHMRQTQTRYVTSMRENK